MIKLKKILVPTDFSECNKSAVDFAVSLANRFGSELVLFHSVWMTSYEYTQHLSPNYDVSYSQFLEDRRLAAVAMMSDMDLSSLVNPDSVTSVSVKGEPVTELLDYANANDIDLIVIGTHGHTGLKRFFLGSVAEKTVRHSSCPVITVRDKSAGQAA